MPSSKQLSGTTNEGQTLGSHPENRVSKLEEYHQECSPPVLPLPLAKTTAASRQTPDTQEEPVLHCPHRNQYPLRHY
jgi:hypothetical protein